MPVEAVCPECKYFIPLLSDDQRFLCHGGENDRCPRSLTNAYDLSDPFAKFFADFPASCYYCNCAREWLSYLLSGPSTGSHLVELTGRPHYEGAGHPDNVARSSKLLSVWESAGLIERLDYRPSFSMAAFKALERGGKRIKTPTKDNTYPEEWAWKMVGSP